MGLAFNPKPDNVAVAQLVHLHAQLGAKLQANRRERAKLAADMKHVEAVIRLFNPAYDTRRIAVKRRNKPNALLKWGTVWRNAIDVLRVAEKPLTVREVADRVLVAMVRRSAPRLSGTCKTRSPRRSRTTRARRWQTRGG
jgi:hypothetical protein